MLDPNTERELIRHLLATLSFRFHIAVDGAPEGFGDHAPGNEGWTPSEVTRHMTHVIRVIRREFDPDFDNTPLEPVSFDEEIARFDAMVRAADEDFEVRPPLSTKRIKVLLQGPISDAMTHVGQIAMMRRQSGSPVTPTNFMRAEVELK